MPQVVKATKAPPKIDRATLGGGQLTCKVNQQLVLEVPVEGAPAPETSWWRDGQELRAPQGQGQDPLRVSHGPNLAKLMFIPARRLLRGRYLLKARNAHGQDEADVDIGVLGKPDPPQGPLSVSEVTKKTCQLSWNPPQDNGGHQITGYEIEKLDPNLEQWLPVGRTQDTSFLVKGLSEGKCYKFLVRAVNKAGDSQELIMEEPIIAKNMYNPPSQPGRPEIGDWGEKYAELRWNSPEEDGGAEISSYRIEIRNRDKRGWIQAGTSDESDSTISDNIEPGNEYEFRIIAVNSAGESETSLPSKTFLPRQRFVKPKINRDMLTAEKSAYTSQTLRLHTEVKGEPLPQISWWSPTGAKLESGDKVSIETEGYKTSIAIRDLNSKDSGVYKVKGRNSEGSDEAELVLTVKGPPSAPLGPLEVSNVTANGCTLSWKRPETDGGLGIKMYSVEKKSVEKDNWVPCAQVAGKLASVMKTIECTLSNLMEGDVYVFRILAINAQGESEPLECFAPVCASPAIQAPGKPGTPRVKEMDKMWIKLEWSMAPGSDVGHYIIEKQEQFMVPKVQGEDEEEKDAKMDEGLGEDPRSKGRPILQSPSSFSGEFQEYRSKWMAALVTDDNSTQAKIKDLGDNHTYLFRVKAVNKAGTSEPSEPTKEIVNKAKQRPIIERRSLEACQQVSKGDTIKLHAKFNGDPIPDRKWYFGDKAEIKPSGSVSIEDKDHASKLSVINAKRGDSGQYKFHVENEFGQETALVDVVVMVEPSKPIGPLTMDRVHATGCSCSWQEPEDDGGNPITHYIVERIATGHSQWTQCGRSDSTTCQVTDLIPEKEYRLQVRAVNQMGESEPLTAAATFIAENPFGAPGAPGTPEMVDGDCDHLVMCWDAPKHDGGSSITGYQLEARKWKSSTYFPAGEVKWQMEKGEARKVELGQSYAVRVRALNAAGPGPWSMDSDRVVVKQKALKPKVSFGPKRELTVTEGEPLSLTITIEGEPPPEEVTLSLNDKSLGNDQSQGILIEHKPYTSCLMLTKAHRKYQGTLTCTAENRHGISAASVKVQVHGKPMAPQGRLNVSSLSRSSCRLSWEPCADSGGLPVTYVVEKLVVSTKAWSKQGSTTTTVYEVRDLECGHRYSFRVRAVNSIGESDTLEADKPITAKDKFEPSLPPGPPVVTDWSDHHMDIEWTEPLDDGGCPIQGYHIEARLNSSGSWQLWETLNTNQCNVSLQKLLQGTEYQFRAIAVTRAGKSEPSHPSRAKIARAKNAAPSLNASLLRDVKAVAGDRVKLEVTFQGEPTPDVTWTRAGCADPLSSSRSQDLSLTDTDTSSKLVFNSIAKLQEGTYTVKVINDSGSDSAQVHIVVRDRPQAPEGLVNTLSEGGKCCLSWKRSPDDGGAPIDYYQIERLEETPSSSSSSSRGWLACGRAKEGSFEALGLLPGRKYRFRVTAVNRFGSSDPLETEDVGPVVPARSSSPGAATPPELAADAAEASGRNLI